MELKLKNLFVEPGANPKETSSSPDRETIRISGMLCGLWARRVKRALEGLPNVESANVQLVAEKADIFLKVGSTFDPEAVRQAIDRIIVFPQLRRALAKIKKKTMSSLRLSSKWLIQVSENSATVIEE